MPLLRVLTTCPGTDWEPGRVVEATVEQANAWADGTHAVVVRDESVERTERR